MEELNEIGAALSGAKTQLKSAQRTLRTTLQVVNDLERRLEEALNAEPKEGTANGHKRSYAVNL